jgi:hypothetical protein
MYRCPNECTYVKHGLDFYITLDPTADRCPICRMSLTRDILITYHEKRMAELSRRIEIEAEKKAIAEKKTATD